jgi:hypothetical protein
VTTAEETCGAGLRAPAVRVAPLVTVRDGDHPAAEAVASRVRDHVARVSPGVTPGAAFVRRTRRTPAPHAGRGTGCTSGTRRTHGARRTSTAAGLPHRSTARRPPFDRSPFNCPTFDRSPLHRPTFHRSPFHDPPLHHPQFVSTVIRLVRKDSHD